MDDSQFRRDHDETPDNLIMWGTEPDDDLALLLRSELGREAASINPSDRFADILQATEQAEQRRSPWRWVGVAAVILLLGGVVAPFVFSKPTAPGPASSPSSPSAVQPSASTLQTQQVGLPVFYVNSQNHLFYQESRNLPTLTDSATTAVNAVLNVAPNNAQYESMWKGGTVLGVQVRSNAVYVNLSKDAYDGFTDTATATDAAFEIYYTVNQVLNQNRSPLNVVLESNGSTHGLSDSLDTTAGSGFWSNGPAQGPVWIASPQSGDTVPAGKVTFRGNINPGNPAPMILISHADGSGPVNATTTLASGADDNWQPWTYTTTLAKGEYQVTVTALGTTNTVVFTVS